VAAVVFFRGFFVFCLFIAEKLSSEEWLKFLRDNWVRKLNNEDIVQFVPTTAENFGTVQSDVEFFRQLAFRYMAVALQANLQKNEVEYNEMDWSEAYDDANKSEYKVGYWPIFIEDRLTKKD